MKEVKLIHFDAIDSTNNWAKENPEQWLKKGVTLITAGEQTAGRGRFKRTWISPPNLNIYATFCFWIDPQRQDIGHIPQLLALTTVEMLEKRGFYPKIKWPNDIQISEKKLGGILCETIIESEKRGVVCGIGLNVNMPSEILEKIDRPATSLFVEKNVVLNVSEVLEDLKKAFLSGLEKFLFNGFNPFFSHFEKRSALSKGDFVHFHDNQNQIKAQFEKILPNGSVELRLPDGKIKQFHAGEFSEILKT